MIFYLERVTNSMNITVFFAILAFAVLIFIAAELYVIAREISRGITVLLKEREAREGQAPGQTINVNLSPTGATTQNVTPAGTATVSNIELNREGSASPDGENEKPPKSPEVSETKAKPTSPFSVICDKCHAENSSYRGECFNCGGRL